MGRLTMNTEPHQKCSSNRPLVIGPSAPPTPANAAQIAMAFGRSWIGNEFKMIDNVAGMINAAPTPISVRMAISWVGSVAWLAVSAAPPKMSRPISSAPFRPNRSPSAPAGSRSPAKTSAYASTIHCSSVPVAPSSRWIVGRATFSALTAITIVTRLRFRIARISQRRW